MVAWAEEFFTRLQMGALSLLNPFFFAVRRQLRFTRRGYREGPCDPHALPPAIRARLFHPAAQRLEARYGLRDLMPHLDAGTYLTALMFAELLDALLSRSRLLGDLPDRVAALDIGAKNFESAPGIHRVLSRHSQVKLTGIEIDAFRVYRSLHSRADVARYYAGLLGPEHRFIGGDLLDHLDRYELVTWFHPFLDAYPLLHWGLPRRLLKPEAAFAHMLARLRPGGVAIIVNQEQHEKQLQIELMTAANVEFESFDLALDLWAPRDEPRYAHVLRVSG